MTMHKAPQADRSWAMFVGLMRAGHGEVFRIHNQINFR